MNTPDHDEDFERWLQRAEPLPPPAEWKAVILSAAQSAATRQRLSSIAPRWLLTGWGLAWAAALVLWLGTPSSESEAARVTTTPDLNKAIQQRREILVSLLAANTP